MWSGTQLLSCAVDGTDGRLRQIVRQFAVLLPPLFAILCGVAIPARAQELSLDPLQMHPLEQLDGGDAFLGDGVQEPTVITIEEAERQLADREQALRQAHDAWQQGAGDPFEQAEARAVDEVQPSEADPQLVSPKPDDPDGEITREREKQAEIQ